MFADICPRAGLNEKGTRLGARSLGITLVLRSNLLFPVYLTTPNVGRSTYPVKLDWPAPFPGPEKPARELLQAIVAILLRLSHDALDQRTQPGLTPEVPRRCLGACRIAHVSALQKSTRRRSVIPRILAGRQGKPGGVTRTCVFVDKSPGHDPT